ncbi:MAG: hypothetical protein HLUCCA12_16325 [Rhodobacteraceae bacterium HLUCCA12]|nr:MAG: hypothetical protein HLUCCA12_16325 [Rhodobacteraceae bacterium HLUCCA12]
MTDIVTLKALCDEVKIDPREAREHLRAAAGDAKANPELAKARKPRTPWQWAKGSAAAKYPLSRQNSTFDTNNSEVLPIPWTVSGAF